MRGQHLLTAMGAARRAALVVSLSERQHHLQGSLAFFGRLWGVEGKGQISDY